MQLPFSETIFDPEDKPTFLQADSAFDSRRNSLLIHSKNKKEEKVWGKNQFILIKQQ